MAKKWLLFKQLAKKSWIEFRRYFFNSMGGIITLYVVFLVIFMGYKGIAGAAGPDLGTSIEGILVGYVLWFLALSAYQDVAYSIQNEARQGTLEQLYMSVHNFGWVIGLQQIVNAFYSLLVASVLTFFLMLTTGKWLTID
ncbi:MAG: ABC transporter permease, partial [Bacillota bacterium]